MYETFEQNQINREGVNYSDDEMRVILVSVFCALQELGSIGYSHGDVKHDNIFISRHGEVLLGDFGTCRPLGQTFDSLTTWPKYTALEASKGPYVNTQYLDIWTMGIVVYEIEKHQIMAQGSYTYDDVMNCFKNSARKSTMKTLFTALLTPNPCERPTLATILGSHYLDVDSYNKLPHYLRSLHVDPSVMHESAYRIIARVAKNEELRQKKRAYQILARKNQKLNDEKAELRERNLLLIPQILKDSFIL